MDFIGDIVEHEVGAPVAPSATQVEGFPKRVKKESRWKLRMKKRDDSEDAHPLPKKITKQLSESEKIHEENMKKISQMTEGEIANERDELLESLDPNLVKSLLKRVEKRQKHEHENHTHAEGHDGWIGGDKEGNLSLPSLDLADVDLALGINQLNIADDISADKEDAKKVRFDDVATIKYEDLDDDVELDPNGWEDVEDVNDLFPGAASGLDEVADKGYQLVEDEEDEEKLGVHFPKPITTEDQELDLNDPEFYNKLHEKYYPDLPKETNKLSWMTTPMPRTTSTTYESIGDMRFDFKGNLVELNEDEDKNGAPTYLGLHHHSENPHLAGYTLAELAHLSRSVVPGQRCVSIQVLGRVLHKLGLHKYNILPVSEDPQDAEFNESIKEVLENFEKMMWDLIEELRIIETLTEAADEAKTKNLSVRNYALEALWLWRQGQESKEEEEKKV